jgi:hypothetical protein
VQTKLKTFPDVVQVDIILANSVTPTLAQLMQYACVIVWGWNQFTNPATLGDNLADYIDAGGGVVLADFIWGWSLLTGRFQTKNYASLGICVGKTGV